MKRAVCCTSDTRMPEQSTPWRSSQERYSAKSSPTAPTSSGRAPRTPRPKAMFAAAPPRRTCRSSTRNDSETLCSCSTTRLSANRPWNTMRWSVAMDPVTAMRTGRHPTRVAPRAAARVRTVDRPPRSSVEAVAAGAAAGRVRVVDREALLLDGVGEVDRGAVEVGSAHPVDDDLDAAEVAQQVAVEHPLVEVELVDEAGAAAGLDGDPQAQVVAALLLEQALHLAGGDVGELHTVNGALGLARRAGLVLECHAGSLRRGRELAGRAGSVGTAGATVVSEPGPSRIPLQRTSAVRV